MINSLSLPDGSWNSSCSMNRARFGSTPSRLIRVNSWPRMWRKMDVADAVGAASACWVCGDRNVSMASWPASKGCIAIRLGLIDDVRPVSWGSRNWSEPISWQSDIQSTALCPWYLRLKFQDDAATIQHQVYLSSPLQSCTPTDGANEQNNRIGVETNQKKQTVKSKKQQRLFSAHLLWMMHWNDLLMTKRMACKWKIEYEASQNVETNQKKRKVKSGRGYFLLIYLKPCTGMIGWWAKEQHANEG